MYWVSSVKDNTWGVTDTVDGVETYFSAYRLLQISKKHNIEIDGVDVMENKVCLVKLAKDTVRLIQQGKIHLAIHTMSIFGNWFGIRFEYKRKCGEDTFIEKQVVNICRSGVDRFTTNLGTSKSSKTNISLEDVLTILDDYRGWSIKEVRDRML